MSDAKSPEDLEPVVTNAKDVSRYPGNENGTVQPTTVAQQRDLESENNERETTRLAEERKHHEECGS